MSEKLKHGAQLKSEISVFMLITTNLPTLLIIRRVEFLIV